MPLDLNAAADSAELARTLHGRWQRGEKKSQLEIETWDDATSHGRHFDRFVRTHLGISTTKPSKQTENIADLQRQIRGLGAIPLGSQPAEWELQLRHARESCLAALRSWNDPTGRFRAGAFALMFVTAWNSLAIAVQQKTGGEWRKLSTDGTPTMHDGVEQSLDTKELVALAFAGDDPAKVARRANIRFWVDLRNSAAHRHLPELDLTIIPQAQAGLVNFESALIGLFGAEYALADSLTVPLQLMGFRDPGILASRKTLQAGLPLDVQALLNREAELSHEIVANIAYQMRVAFVPVVPASGRNADAVAYFVKPGEVPTELGESLEKYVVMPKLWQGGIWFKATDAAAEVQRRTGFQVYCHPTPFVGDTEAGSPTPHWRTRSHV